LTWAEEDRLFAELPPHLAAMARFAVNTGCRDGEICELQWAWEVDVPELGISVFLIAANRVCGSGADRPALEVLRRGTSGCAHKMRTDTRILGAQDAGRIWRYGTTRCDPTRKCSP
jgi:hypothetical protein